MEAEQAADDDGREPSAPFPAVSSSRSFAAKSPLAPEALTTSGLTHREPSTAADSSTVFSFPNTHCRTVTMTNHQSLQAADFRGLDLDLKPNKPTASTRDFTVRSPAVRYRYTVTDLHAQRTYTLQHPTPGSLR